MGEGPSVAVDEENVDMDDADADTYDDDYLDDAYEENLDDFVDDLINEEYIDTESISKESTIPEQQQQVSNKFAISSLSFSDMNSTTFIIPVIILLVIIIGLIIKRKRNKNNSASIADSSDTLSTPGTNVNYDFVDPSCRGGFQKQYVQSASDDYVDEDGWGGYDNIQLT